MLGVSPSAKVRKRFRESSLETITDSAEMDVKPSTTDNTNETLSKESFGIFEDKHVGVPSHSATVPIGDAPHEKSNIKVRSPVGEEVMATLNGLAC